MRRQIILLAISLACGGCTGLTDRFSTANVVESYVQAASRGDSAAVLAIAASDQPLRAARVIDSIRPGFLSQLAARGEIARTATSFAGDTALVGMTLTVAEHREHLPVELVRVDGGWRVSKVHVPHFAVDQAQQSSMKSSN